MTAGKLRNLLLFQKRATGDDGFNNPVSGEFQTMFTDAAELIPIKGGEAVLASRLQGIQPYVIRVRSSASTRSMDTTWQAVDKRNPLTVFSFTAISDIEQKNAYLDILATVGAAS